MRYPKVGYWYLTNACDHRCRHCLTRSNTPLQADYDLTMRSLREFRELGGIYVDLTGGNPLLVEWLDEALKLCVQKRLMTSLTLSGPRIIEVQPEVIRLPYLLRISIDGMPDYHNENRGRDCFDFIVEGLNRARDLRRGKRIQLLFTAMPGPNGNINREQLAFVLGLAREHRVLVNVNPLFGTKIFTSQELSELSWFADQANVQCSMGKLLFIQRGGNNTRNPTCGAIRNTVTISPSGELVLPCYHHLVSTISLENGLLAALESKERLELIEYDGRFDFCKGCSIWCYIIPSWISHIWNRRVVWLHALSWSRFQSIRDFFLQTFGRLHLEYPYPQFRT